ncbi:BPSS1187 family protein [Elizabethkingia ursingii]|uniref:BPSS1187 family protein n=1 Tax=Elizabethkingia ursingii TaxID=1756150 RepID=UPI0010547ADA|nr:hypothetical protein [Elizabethkingia ursingii]
MNKNESNDIKMKKNNLNFLVTVLLFLLLVSGVHAQEYTILRIKPSITDTSITNWDIPHVIKYDPTIQNNKLLLFLQGTRGTTMRLPDAFLNTALEKGYKVIAISYITDPGISGICIGDNLRKNNNCAYDFRRYRIYGDNAFPLIKDQPQDAIVNRVSKLLIYLIKNDPHGNWEQYIDMQTGKIKWDKIVISGQSQGGGMAQFIGQHENVAKVISFSGGWDYRDAETKTIADWYTQPCVTPDSNWFAVYHVKEAAAEVLKKICNTLPIPKNQIFAVDGPLRNISVTRGKNPYHGEGLTNIIYKPIWQTMLGSGIINKKTYYH